MKVDEWWFWAMNLCVCVLIPIIVLDLAVRHILGSGLISLFLFFLASFFLGIVVGETI